MTGIAGGLALYVLVEGERRYSIDRITDIVSVNYFRTEKLSYSHLLIANVWV